MTKQIDLLLANAVLGADPHDVTVLWGVCTQAYACAVTALDSSEAISSVAPALGMLSGKLPGSRCIAMGGAFRATVRVYASGLPALAANAAEADFLKLGEEAEAIRERGFTGLKMAIGKGIEGDLKSVRTVRRQLGDDFLIYVDAAVCMTKRKHCTSASDWKTSESDGLRCQSFPKTSMDM